MSTSTSTSTDNMSTEVFWMKTRPTKTGRDIVSRRVARGGFPGLSGEYGDFRINFKAVRHRKGGYTARLEMLNGFLESGAEAVLVEELPAFGKTRPVVFSSVDEIVLRIKKARRSEEEYGISFAPQYFSFLAGIGAGSDWHL